MGRKKLEGFAIEEHREAGAWIKRVGGELSQLADAVGAAYGARMMDDVLRLERKLRTFALKLDGKIIDELGDDGYAANECSEIYRR